MGTLGGRGKAAGALRGPMEVRRLGPAYPDGAVRWSSASAATSDAGPGNSIAPWRDKRGGPLGGATPGLTLTSAGGTPAVPPPTAGWALGSHVGWLKGPLSAGDGEVPWGREPFHPRLLWERGARAVQPPGSPVRPGWGVGASAWAQGGQLQPLSLVHFCPWQVGLALPSAYLRAGSASPLPPPPRCRYVVEPPRLPLAARLKPPFLRPELLDRAPPLKVKLSDNGLKAGLGRSKVGALGWVGDGVKVRPSEARSS